MATEIAIIKNVKCHPRNKNSETKRKEKHLQRKKKICPREEGPSVPIVSSGIPLVHPPHSTIQSFIPVHPHILLLLPLLSFPSLFTSFLLPFPLLWFPCSSIFIFIQGSSTRQEHRPSPATPALALPFAPNSACLRVQNLCL
jgi:hypothetical protein